MPPFRLELPDRLRNKRIPTTLYSRKLYCPGVKVSGWESYSESLPVDVNPYCPTAFNLHYSHYDHLGVDDKINYISSTQGMLLQMYERRRDLEVDPHKAFMNLYSEIDTVDESEVKTMCSSHYSQDYRTTMQHHFQAPYPAQIQRLSIPDPPYFLHRRLKNTGLCKFLDDDYVLQTKRLQKHKKIKSISFNPGTGSYTEVESKCEAIKELLK